jgi:sugar O-acyltransferase (sialic acid O-acetyltransferase NeuD family)
MTIHSLILVGSGGFATEIADYLAQDFLRAGGPRVAGVIDDFASGLVEIGELPFLGRLADVEARDDTAFVITSGTPRYRADTLAALLKRGARIASVVHSSAYVARDAVIGDGCVICPFAIVNAGARLAEGVVLNVHSSVGHGASAGPCSVLSPYAALNGWASIGEQCFLGTRSTIFPKVRIGDRCTVDSHSFVKADVGDRMIVSVRGQYTTVPNRLEGQP